VREFYAEGKARHEKSLAYYLSLQTREYNGVKEHILCNASLFIALVLLTSGAAMAQYQFTARPIPMGVIHTERATV
jgi:hypothetical protein